MSDFWMYSVNLGVLIREGVSAKSFVFFIRNLRSVVKAGDGVYCFGWVILSQPALKCK